MNPPLAVAVVATYNRLHTVLNLVRSIRRAWARQPKVYVALVDHCHRERPGFESLDDVEIVPATALEVPDFWWQAAKFGPGDLGSVLKPYLLRHVVGRGHDAVVSCDSDMHFFDDACALVDHAPRADLVFVPRGPVSCGFPEDWPTTTNDVADAEGVDGGLFVVRRRPGALAFLEAWGQLSTAPDSAPSGAGDPGGPQALNSALSYVDHVAVFRDPRFNIAYADLHGWPLRWSHLDGRREDEWTLDGRPIVCCRFGADDSPSPHENRHDSPLNVHLVALGRHYGRRLHAANAAHYSTVEYEYGEVEGRPLTPEIREELRHLDGVVSPALDSWKDVPEALRQAAHLIGRTSVLPMYLERILEGRRDLQALDGPDSVFPTRFLWWANRWLRTEYSCGLLHEHYTDTVFARHHFDMLAREIAGSSRGLSVENAIEALRADRWTLVERLRRHDARAQLLQEIEVGIYRYPAFDPVLCIRLIYEDRPDLQRAFPDPLGGNFAEFRTWLCADLPKEYELPPGLSDFGTTVDPQASFARLLAYTQRSDAWRTAVAERGLGSWAVPHLVRSLRHAPGYDSSDVVIVMWWLEKHGPEARLAIDRTFVPPLATRAAGAYLEWWCRRNQGDGGLPIAVCADALRDFVEKLGAARDRLGRVDAPGAGEPAGVRRFVAACETARMQLRPSGAREALAPRLAPDPRGVNVFGCFRSPIGLGATSSGLVAALDRAGFHTRRIVLADATMDRDLTPEDLHPDFGFSFGRNIVVTSPRAHHDSFAVFPPEFFEGRETSAYVAWDQRELRPSWGRTLERYDRLFAPSRFTADAVATRTGRPCEVIPRVVDVDLAACGAAPREIFGIPPDTFVVGLVLDSPESVERTNSVEAVRVVGRALAGRKALLVLDVPGGGRARPARPVQVLVDEARRHGLAHLVTDCRPRARLEALLACFDAYLSLHRGDDFGYRIAQAMTLGVPVVATGYPESLDVLTAENAYVVASREVVIRLEDGPFQLEAVRAVPDLDDAIEQCRRVYDNPAEAKLKAASARAHMRAVASVEAVARRLTQLFP